MKKSAWMFDFSNPCGFVLEDHHSLAVAFYKTSAVT
jgi:hypothetical protein